MKQITEWGKELLQQKLVAEKEAQHLAACLAGESTQSTADSYQRQAQHSTQMVPVGHLLAEQIAIRASSMLQIIAQVCCRWPVGGRSCPTRRGATDVGGHDRRPAGGGSRTAAEVQAKDGRRGR